MTNKDDDLLEDEDVVEEVEDDEPVFDDSRKKKVPRIAFHAAQNTIVDQAISKESENRIVLIVVPNAKWMKGILNGVKDKVNVKKQSMFSVNNIHLAYKVDHMRGLDVGYVIVQSEVDPDLALEVLPFIRLTPTELEEFPNILLKQDSNRELCRKCKEADPDSIPYGSETGQIESVPQFDENGDPLLDEDGNMLYLDFPELRCEKGHRWYKGEGPRRDIKGKNPILFESHLYNRRRREIMVNDGIPDPAFTMDRHGRPTQGIYNRSHPDGRKINDKAQRAKHGASYYR